MTSLDTLLSKLKTDCEFIAAIQNTPQDILFVVTSENFWRSLNLLNVYDVRLRFLEVRELSLDIHLFCDIQDILFTVTFRVIDYSPYFLSEIVKHFPYAAVFVSEITKKTSSL